MLARQTRSGISLQRFASVRSIARPSSRCLPLQTATQSLGRRCVVTQQFQPRKRRGSESNHTISSSRSLATAVDDYQFSNSTYNHLAGSGLSPFQPPSSAYFDIRGSDPSSPLVIPEPGPRNVVPNKMNTRGIPGDTEDMLPLFDACIRVGRLERAALVLRRLNTTGLIPGEERILLHNQYLRASLNHLRNSPNRTQAEELHKWYEVHIRTQGIPQTAETVACMLKASLLSERGSRLERLIKRYMNMAPGEAGLRVLSMADILTDQDLGVITEVCPTYSFAPETEDAVTLVAEEEQMELEAELEGSMELPPAEAYPEVRATPQRGEGLRSLKSSLSLMDELQTVDISKLSVEEQQEFQVRLERDSIDAAIAKWRSAKKALDKMGVSTALKAKAEDGSLTSNFQSWLEGMSERIKLELVKVEEAEAKESKSEEDLERCVYGPFLRQGDPTRLAAVTILSILNNGAMMGLDKGVILSRLVNDVSRIVQEDLRLQAKEKEAKEFRRRRKVQFTGKLEDIEPSEDGVIIDAHEPQTPQTDSEDVQLKPWSMIIRARVGSILVKALIETAKVKVTKENPITREMISQYQPAFSHMQAPRKGKKVGLLVLNPDLVERLLREPVGDFIAKHLPMVAEPRPWKRMYEGGFLESKTSLVRVKPGEVEQKLYTKAAIQRGDMAQVFKGLDVLGQTPWRVNNDVLDVMVEAWNSGEKIANMPPLEPLFDLPPEPVSSDPLERRQWVRAIKSIENERSALHSQRCYMNLQLEIARAFRKQTIYFPHNVDYRGRAYPIPTYLNHMGADHTRSILKFAKGKELGVNGLRWLKIHIANVYGFDKASFDEREAFATDNLANIVESATNPLKGSRWWLKAEDPWQCLAACFELKAAHELDDPTQFVSQLPVHQDGTCNGLQHYAALGGDTWGAQQVNLMPGKRPADVYSAVADLVKQSIAKDAEAGNRFAEIATGRITRKVVKQTVMTNVYGVTFAGAKKQVCKQIDALYPNLHKETGIPHIVLSTYIAKHIFGALATMFRGAHDIQYWLGEIGGRVCRALTPAQLEQISESFEKGDNPKSQKIGMDELTKQFRSTVVWTTPLRMPVAQPYRKATLKEVHTCLQAVTYPVNDQTDPVNRRKQLQGFPPNFIHSLDASHMLLSALQCSELGLNFAAVHDSFWTHAADIDVMNGVLREAFIRIHEEDVVGRLAAEFEARYKGSLYLANIDADSPVGKKIKEFRKNSKLSPKEELLLEYKRSTLLQSGTPWNEDAASKIVTPGSLYEEMAAAEEDVVIPEETQDIGLGNIPADEAKLDEAEFAESLEALKEDYVSPVSAAFSDQLLQKMKHTRFEEQVIQAKKEVDTKRAKKPMSIWLPLTFPNLPKKVRCSDLPKNYSVRY